MNKTTTPSLSSFFSSPNAFRAVPPPPAPPPLWMHSVSGPQPACCCCCFLPSPMAFHYLLPFLSWRCRLHWHLSMPLSNCCYSGAIPLLLLLWKAQEWLWCRCNARILPKKLALATKMRPAQNGATIYVCEERTKLKMQQRSKEKSIWENDQREDWTMKSNSQMPFTLCGIESNMNWHFFGKVVAIINFGKYLLVIGTFIWSRLSERGVVVFSDHFSMPNPMGQLNPESEIQPKQKK